MIAIEVGARDFAADNLKRAATAIGFSRIAVKKLVREVGQEVKVYIEQTYFILHII